MIFCGGIVAGIILTIGFSFILYSLGSAKNNGTTWFEKPRDVVNEKVFKVFQVLDDNAALVYGKDELDITFTGAVYLLTNENDKYYYDDEIIAVPANKVVRQVGIYKYNTKSDFGKTVPIIQIMDN